MQPDPTKKRKKNAGLSDDDIKKYQMNYINRYSTLFMEKTQLNYKLLEANAIVEEQRQQIEKLTTKKDLRDAATQTEAEENAPTSSTSAITTTTSTQTECTGQQCINDGTVEPPNLNEPPIYSTGLAEIPSPQYEHR